MASQPQKMRWYRAISRVAQQAVTNNTVSKEDPEFQEFHRLALKIPEHTWGREGPCLGNYTNQEFHDPHYLCSIGSEFYQLAVDSYSDQQAYVLKAIAALSSYPNLQQQMNDTLNSSEPAMPDFSELLPYDNVGQAFTIFNTSIMYVYVVSFSYHNSGSINRAALLCSNPRRKRLLAKIFRLVYSPMLHTVKSSWMLLVNNMLSKDVLKAVAIVPLAGAITHPAVLKPHDKSRRYFI